MTTTDSQTTIARLKLVISRIVQQCKEDESNVEAFRDVLPFVKKPGLTGLEDALETAMQAAGTSAPHLEGLCNILDDGLDDLMSDDFFGTEGQSDPRGDARNGEWSMWRVEGIDS